VLRGCGTIRRFHSFHRLYLGDDSRLLVASSTQSVTSPCHTPKDENDPSPALLRRAPSPLGRGLWFEVVPTPALSLGERVASGASRVRGIDRNFPSRDAEAQRK
jgi:hypothetical protein